MNVCPAKEKALVFEPIDQQKHEIDNWNYAVTLSKKNIPLSFQTVKGSQFSTPLLEFSGACAGCGETPYAKLLTQLFGDQMMIANATGCSSIWGASAPSTPYTTNEQGKGPSWANSLFEDNAEFGYGMYLAVKQIRNKIKSLCEEIIKHDIPENIKNAVQAWLENYEDLKNSKTASENLIRELDKYTPSDNKISDIINNIMENKSFLARKTQWIIGGDGWAYDIGFGGLDHVIASGEDINILIFDTEVYSNTGGQASKSTPTAVVAQFAASGKTGKKDLGLIAMSYGYVYVAQVAMGANQINYQSTDGSREYKGPSVIIAYSPCISHGIKAAWGNSNNETGVEAGY